MDHFSYRQTRIDNATPATRAILRAASALTLSALGLITLAVTAQMVAPFGIIIHTPQWYLVLVYLAAFGSAFLGAYAMTYITRVTSLWHVLRVSGAAAAFSSVLTFAAAAWAIPALSTVVATTPVSVVRDVQNTYTSRRARLGCHTQAIFGPLYDPQGRVCLDAIIADAPKIQSAQADSSARYFVPLGDRIELQGRGNAWASWVTHAKMLR